MKTIFTIFILSVLPILTFCQQDSIIFRIEVISNSIGKNEKIFITGNNIKFGNWHPGKVELIRTNNHWEKVFIFPQNIELEYKLTKGSWETEALDENGNVSGNFNIIAIKDTTIKLKIEKWKDISYSENPLNTITGNVKIHKQIGFKDLIPRDIIVWLPPDYELNPNKRFPVLYMHDGQNLFSPKTSFTGIDWQLDETADSLIRKGYIEPIIIVGIYNTSDRSEEYSPSVKGNTYMQFVVTKLKSMIDSTYRTLPEREYTATGGSSSGGLISFMLAWNYSSYFSKAACFSPAFKYEDFDYTKYVKEYMGPKKDLKIYIDNGGIGLEGVLQPGVDLMQEVLLEKGYKLEKDLYVLIDSTAEHNEAAWAKRVHNPLIDFYGINITINQSTNESLDNLLNNRNRIQLSINTMDSREGLKIISYYTFNINYRNSHIGLSELAKPATLSISTELGLNIFSEPLIFLPYFKVGPEIRIYQNYYCDIHAGIGVALSGHVRNGEILSALIPFYGGQIGYILSLTNKSSLEFELGFNGIYPYYIYYFGLAFSI